MFREKLIAFVAHEVVRAKSFVIAITGGGLSEKKIRDKLKKALDNYPKEIDTIEGFIENPKKAWKYYNIILRVLAESELTDAHRALAELESLGILTSIITTTVDGLHQMAGSKNVLEMHGNINNLKCLSCRRIESVNFSFDQLEMPPKCRHCSSILKPGYLLYNERLPSSEMMDAIIDVTVSKVMFIIGFRRVVEPIPSLIKMAKRYKAMIIEINPEETWITSKFSDYFIKGDINEVLTKIVKSVGRIIKSTESYII
jgi:NAD-dependent deacetylase